MTENFSTADERRAALKAIPMPGGRHAVVPQDFEQIWRLATMFAASGGMVPEIYRDNANAAAMAIMWGMELGVTPVQAIQGIAVIGGRPSVWGDLLLAICQSHPKFQDLRETQIMADDGITFLGARAVALREGREPVERTFTVADAAAAGLLQKEKTPWKGYKPRMCAMRARAFALRDAFADALRGIASADEMRDVIDGDFETVPRTQRERQAVAEREPIREPQPKAEPSSAEPKPEAVALPAPEPDLLAALGGITLPRETVAAEQAEHADQAAHGRGQPQARPGGVDFSDLETREDLAPLPAERKPLTKGDQRMLQAYLDTAEPLGITEQDLFDQLGDSVHKGNLQAALAWLQQKCADASKAD